MTGMPQRETVLIAPDDSRKQLGAFLRSAAKASTRSVSVCRESGGGARPAPGREVAMLADVGVTWYTPGWNRGARSIRRNRC